MTHFSWPIDGSIVGLYLIATILLSAAIAGADSRNMRSVSTTPTLKSPACAAATLNNMAPN